MNKLPAGTNPELCNFGGQLTGERGVITAVSTESWRSLGINKTSISFHKKLGLRLAHNSCDCREFYPKTVIYIFTISQFTVTAQSEKELCM